MIEFKGDLPIQEESREELSQSEARVLQIIEVTKYQISSLRGIYEDGKEKEQIRREIRALALWSYYLFHLIETQQFLQNPEQLIELSTLLLEVMTIEEIAGVRTGARTGFNDRNSFRSSYGREGSKKIFFGEMDIPSACFATTHELAMRTKSRYGEPIIRLSGVHEALDISVQVDETTPTDYLLEFQSLAEFQQFRKLLLKSNQSHKRQGEWFFHCNVSLSPVIGCQLLVNWSGQHVSVGIPSQFWNHGVNQPTSPPPKTEIVRALLLQPYDQHDVFYNRNYSRNESIAHARSFFDQVVQNISHKSIRTAIEEEWKRINLDGMSPMHFFLHILSLEPTIETWRRAALFKQLLRVKRIENMSPEQKIVYLDQIESNHQRHYQRLLGDSSSEHTPDITLSRSGVSANGIALMAANEIMMSTGQAAHCFVLDGWYFENQPPPSWDYVDTIATANILLVDSEPNRPLLQQTPNEYTRELNAHVHTFVQAATANPDKTYVLVVDKTSRLLDHDYLSKSDLPTNLVVYETASLTKHQRGARNYYFGVVSAWNNPFVASEMRKFRTDAMGELTPDSIMNFPRLRASEVRENVAHNQLLAKVMKQEFDQAQSNLPEPLRWKWQSYNYFGFVSPPSQVISDYENGQETNIRLLDGSRLIEVFNHFFYAEPEAAQAFEKGDSFGLDRTRLIPFSIPMEKPSQNPKGLKSLVAYRISFGRKTSEEDMQTFAKYLVSYLIKL